MSRVIVRVAMKVTTKATRHSINGSFPASTMSRCHHPSTRSA